MKKKKRLNVLASRVWSGGGVLGVMGGQMIDISKEINL